ncbi:type II secretion system ATPase GspE [Iocasia frigidifontis]|uniref:protein-secreting ATPase n=1 Tax=Iocasia fonsfrigidae TaxID=2682810 RepID=A0A8A7KAP3_9FIRM|nr:type II secretion system ATPase GspE [Iocasia fonsfrigidae]QTL97155.1 type II secretion system ATPase GspE [Iocasia fonsfrigidae]
MIDKRKIDTDLIKDYPREILKEFHLLPADRENDRVILYCDKKPPLPVVDNLEVYGGRRIKTIEIPAEELSWLLNEYLDAPLDTVEEMLNDLNDDSLKDFSSIELDLKTENLEELAQEAPVIRLVNAILTAGLKNNASDIHIEPFEDNLKLRFRIDGVLYENPAPPRELFPAIITRIKIMARLNIAERRLPQEGRIRIKVLGREVDIRVSCIPTLYGESVVLRILDRAAYLLELVNLGFEEDMLVNYKKLVNLPHGILLVTGPTGSGKTTTLYATLNELNLPGRKIITVEDPVEYQLDGVNQIQVKPEIDFTFARGLRSILRQDPDIIMIGEIRDLVTAKIAIQAALTGHLVLATLHTNDAVSAITRLINMGVEEYLLAATIKGVLAQRLVRVLCPQCSIKYKEKKYEKYLPEEYQTKDFYIPVGCDSCNNIGYKGRSGIYELLTITTELEEMIARKVTTSSLRSKASKNGFRELMADGILKAEKGITSLDEIIRVTKN